MQTRCSSNEIVLLPANNSIQILRAIAPGRRMESPRGALWRPARLRRGGRDCREKIPVLVNLKWPERAKDADPEAEQTLRDLRFRDRAPSTPAALAKAGVKFAFYSGGLDRLERYFQESQESHRRRPHSRCGACAPLTLDAAEILGAERPAGQHHAGKNRESSGDRRRHLQREDKSEARIRGWPLVSNSRRSSRRKSPATRKPEMTPAHLTKLAAHAEVGR